MNEKNHDFELYRINIPSLDIDIEINENTLLQEIKKLEKLNNKKYNLLRKSFLVDFFLIIAAIICVEFIGFITIIILFIFVSFISLLSVFMDNKINDEISIHELIIELLASPIDTFTLLNNISDKTIDPVPEKSKKKKRKKIQMD